MAQTAALKLFCPFNAMQMHVRVNSRIPDDFSLFAYVNDHGQPHHMVKSVFLTFCDKIWSDKGFPLVQGHSFCISGAVELLLAGVPPEVVAAVGGWTSLAFLIYWRWFEDILPVHILKAYDSSQISRLKTSIDDFQKIHKIPDSVITACINAFSLCEIPFTPPPYSQKSSTESIEQSTWQGLLSLPVSTKLFILMENEASIPLAKTFSDSLLAHDKDAILLWNLSTKEYRDTSLTWFLSD
ncbi:hypothetical protein BT96DRAFT_1024026 [Gymnopus androsaceus JB14]|uniref:Uncharacterized protein n=1 Tax=Gymnopus androsaceus JB14 TaxID=1447944 RepID=A0A6A4H2I4_9AGAR|nr:hypothetical protein BT96DRAFT_1024026 [Gymnopus androsaceus JB14]